jgi:hypothetical protein
MLWTDKAFEIWMGDAGKVGPWSADEAAPGDATAFERMLMSSDLPSDVTVARAGFVTRAISALADRTRLSRIARG